MTNYYRKEETALEISWSQTNVIDFRLSTGQQCFLKPSSILCLFPATREITVENGRTLIALDEDWEKILLAFLGANRWKSPYEHI